MNKQELRRMNWTLMEGWLELYYESVQEHPKLLPGEQLNLASSKWRRLCQTIGIDMVNATQDYEYGGQILEELVAVGDPCPKGLWLTMTHETAEKILILGMA